MHFHLYHTQRGDSSLRYPKKERRSEELYLVSDVHETFAFRFYVAFRETLRHATVPVDRGCHPRPDFGELRSASRVPQEDRRTQSPQAQSKLFSRPESRL